jgi:hypothetical protein
MFIANLTAEAFETLKATGYVVVMDSPPGCSGRDYQNNIESIVQGEIPDCEITEPMILNGQRMLVFVHHLSDEGTESACCSWRKTAFEKVV